MFQTFKAVFALVNEVNRKISTSSKYWSGRSRGGGGAGVTALVLAGEIGDKDYSLVAMGFFV